jgi:GT2 family glycosyltransferase
LYQERGYINSLHKHLNEKFFDIIGGPAYSMSNYTLISKYLNEIGFLHTPCFDSKNNYACFPTVNIIIRKTAFDALNGFNELFVRPGGEDNNLTLRALKKCYKVFFDPLLSVRHDNDISFRQFLRRYFNYGRGNALNEKLLNLTDEDCCFYLHDVKNVGSFMLKIKKSCYRSLTINGFFKGVIFSLFEVLRSVAYECGGIYEKFTQQRNR